MKQKIFPYRIVLHNEAPTKENIKKTLESEIKDTELQNFEVEKIIGYEIELQMGTNNTTYNKYPQKDTIVKLNYIYKSK